MKTWTLLIALNLVALIPKEQPENDLVLLSVKDNRIELAKAIRFLNASEVKLICVNVDLTKCDYFEQFPTNHYSNNRDTLAMSQPSESEEKLAREFKATRSLLLPSEVRPFGKGKTDEIIGCGYLYPENVATGFVNLISDGKALNQVEKIQISNTYKNEPIAYHFAVRIAFKLNESAARSYIKAHANILQINFDPTRKFKTYSMEHFYKNNRNVNKLKGKIVILSIDHPESYRQLPNKKRMTTSEIFANIACQLIE
jgi:CHASE2 domain-containing sensor protein